MTTRPYKGRYSEEEILALVEGYEELCYRKSSSFIHVRLMDLTQALQKLPLKEYQVLLLYGLSGHSVRQAGRALGIPKSTVQDRYVKGLERLHRILNGQTRTL